MASCENPLSKQELIEWQNETLAIITTVANAIVHGRECALINALVTWDPDGDPMDESRAAQRHERRRVLCGLPARGYKAIRTVEGFSLLGVGS